MYKKYLLYKMTGLDYIRKLIRQYVKQISANYDTLKDAKKKKVKPDVINLIKEAINQNKLMLQQLREMYNKVRRNRPTKREEVPDVTEDIRYLYESYPYYEAQKVFPNSID
jgi:rubrerythrin